MKIIASSIPPQENFFLHAGYISSIPRTFDLQFYVDDEDSEKSSAQPLILNVSKTLQMKEETSASTAKAAVEAPLSPPPTEISLAFNSVPVMALGVIVFFGFVWLLHYLKKYSLRLTTAVLLVGLLLTSLGAFYYSGQETNATPSTVVAYAAHPGVAGVANYKNPFLATKVIMHGLLADGVINSRGTITSLDQIHKEVAFPTTKLTPGMRHALDNYAYDGWGRRFLFSNKDGGKGKTRYRITSVGPDGIPNTKDDITISFDKADNENWDGLRWGLFAQREGNKLLIFFHRWQGNLFNYLNEGLARQKSGSNIFDVWCSDRDFWYSLDRIKQSEQQRLLTTIKEHELTLWVPSRRIREL